MKADALLDTAAKHMRDRAATYDKPEGERSMGATVAAFNIITGRQGGRELSESEGWLLMQILKDVRDRQRKEPHKDSLEDGVAYSALKAEARLAEVASSPTFDWIENSDFSMRPRANARIRVNLRSGMELDGTARDFAWEMDDIPSDIIRWRYVSE